MKGSRYNKVYDEEKGRGNRGPPPAAAVGAQYVDPYLGNTESFCFASSGHTRRALEILFVCLFVSHLRPMSYNNWMSEHCCYR